jgi:hypothetical protein
MSNVNEPNGPNRSAQPTVQWRVLFLDDDPRRAEIFLADNPDAVWVATVADCLEHLEQVWDEVHLDHDLGGEHFVECDREDCGMEVVRWLCQEPRPHLAGTKFLVHTHNPVAGMLMLMQLDAAGFRVEGRPFGSYRPDQLMPPNAPFPNKARGGWFSWLLGRRPSNW